MTRGAGDTVTAADHDPVILAFDTSVAHCAAALLRGDTVLATTCEAMARGQAERLFPLLDDMLGAAGLAWPDLDALGVGTGPGNFTGIRISVAAARGLALSLDIPVFGISTFEAVAAVTEGPHLAIVPAPQDKVYIAPDGQEPALVSLPEAQAIGLPCVPPPDGAALCRAMAQVVRRHLASGKQAGSPAPLYIRAPDAAPARDTPPVILSDAPAV